MAVALPEVALRPQAGAAPSQAVGRPTDFGLGAAARDMEAFGQEMEETRRLAEEVQFEEDDAFAERVVTAFSEQYEPVFSEQGAGWRGEGFARAAAATYETAEQAVRRGDGEARTASQQAAVERRLDAYRLSVLQRSIQHEAGLAGRAEAERIAAEDASAGNRLFGDFLTAFAPEFQRINAAFDGTDPAYEANVLAAHDAATAEVLARTPEHLRPALQTRFEADRLSRQAASMDVRARTHAAVLQGQYEQNADALVNSVLVSPALAEGIEPQIAALVAPLPAAERPERERELRGQVAVARLTGFINMGETEQARQEIQSGRWNQVLEPGQTAQLLQRIETAEENSPAAIVERLRMEDAVESDVLSVLETGVGVAGVTVEEVARVLGPARAAEHVQQRAQAERLRGTFAGWAAMTAAEITAQVEALRPEAGSPDFARESQTYELARRRLAGELERRREDPVGWALEASPQLGGMLEAITQGDETARRRAALTYGRSLFETFAAAGIEDGRRLLPPDQARRIVARFEREGAEGLQGLSQFVSSFSPPRGATAAERRDALNHQGAVMAQLWAAGAEPADLAAAVDLADDPVGLGRYVAVRGQRPDLTPTQRREVREELAAALGPFQRSYAPLPVPDVLRRGRTELAQRLAEAGVARGLDAEDAAESAARTLAGGYRFVGRAGFRLPASRAADAGPIEQGAARALRGYAQNDGARFWTPPDRGDGLGPSERREAYADHVTSAGRWTTAADDSGLVLMVPELDGSWAPARTAEGAAIAYTWDQLAAHGRGSGVTGGGGGPLWTVAPPPIRPAGGGGRSQPIGVRNNNPGNLRPSGDQWQGLAGEAGGFLRFRTAEHGIRALGVNLLTYQRRGLDTVSEIITRWAPPSENDTQSYIATVARALGVRPDQRLNLRDEQTLMGLMVAIARHENGGDFFTGTQFLAGARAALRGR